MDTHAPMNPAKAGAIAEISGSRERERIHTVVVEDPQDLAVLVAERIVEVVHRETEG